MFAMITTYPSTKNLKRCIPRLVGFLAICTLMVACAQQEISKDDCAGIDWQAAGLQDGLEGRHFKVLDNYEKQCGSKFSKVQEQLWTKGYLEGMQTFCTEINGFRDGQTNDTMINTCPKDSEYFAGYKRGHQAYMDEQQRIRVEKLTRPDPDNGQRAGRGSSL